MAPDTAWAQIRRRLPDDLEATAQATGAQWRRRQVGSAAALLWLVLACAVGDWSVRLVATLAWPRGMPDLSNLSHVAVRARLRAALPWAQRLVSTLLGLTRAAAGTDWLRLRLVDATTVSAPSSTVWRVPASVWITPPDGPPCLDQLDLTDVHGAESLRRHPVQSGDLLVADRGHARRGDLRALLAMPTTAGPVRGLVCIGWQNLPLQQATPGRPLFGLVGYLPTLKGPTARAVIVATPLGEGPPRLVSTPLPEDAANTARHCLRWQAKQKGRTPDTRSLLAAGYVLLVTNQPAARWEVRAVLALYRVRWQAELVFKRLKGLWFLDHLRAHDLALAQVSLRGTLLGALLADRALAPCPSSPDAPLAAAVAWFLGALWTIVCAHSGYGLLRQEGVERVLERAVEDGHEVAQRLIAPGGR